MVASLVNYATELRRPVITGIGVVSANGCELGEFWRNLCQGRSGAAPVRRFNTSGLPVRIAAEVPPNFNIKDFVENTKAGRFDRTVQYGVAAATLAAKDAGLDLKELDPDRSGVVEGTTISGSESVIKATLNYHLDGYRQVHPYNVVAGYCGEGSSMIGLHLGMRGLAVTYCSGCASGNDAIGYAYRLVQQDEADVVVAGGSEQIVEMLHVGFCRLRAMSERNGDPAGAMRPFDRERDGFVLGEGAAFLIVEELSHALSRGVRIYAEIAGHGRSCEAYHATDPHPDGMGFQRAMEKAFRSARMHPGEVDYINAHGSATPLNDPIESKAIERVFGDHARRLAVSATKPITGHLMGASGAIETAITALTLHHATIPPTINLADLDPKCHLDYVPNAARRYPIRAAVNLNAGFGGRYAALVLRRHGNT